MIRNNKFEFASHFDYIKDLKKESKKCILKERRGMIIPELNMQKINKTNSDEISSQSGAMHEING